MVEYSVNYEGKLAEVLYLIPPLMPDSISSTFNIQPIKKTVK